MQWDEQKGTLVDSLGRGVRLIFVGNKEHVDRWMAAGYDFESAAVRYATFRNLWSTSFDAQQAATVIAEYVAAEQAQALREGVSSSDPDVWRIGAVAKHMIW